ncbi:hypothetical protein F0919_09805 [Taibaiella lutea]|uniref:Uncharacterized protein n=1 Tax=Taibaiella lutea TaxID=2608001 RepID=A0A5M6CIN4_9BACT|nr:hypothetical protein [Taibaiella lutea]KAA5534886.1 hypothetical protein F0919_09805 [Taibaiella lutea]
MDKFLLLILSAILISENSNAQKSKNDSIKVIPVFETDTLMNPVPVNRALFADKVKAQIRQSDLKDGEVDKVIELEDTVISQKLTEALLFKAPEILIHIENMHIPHATKIQYYRILETRMRQWNNLRTTRENAAYIQKSAENFDNILRGIEENNLADYISKNKNIITLDNTALLTNYPDLKGSVYEAVGMASPEMMINRLPEFVNEPYADPVIAAAAKVVPNIVLNYALSTGNLGKAVKRNQDPLVKTIAAIAEKSAAPQKALPFLDEIYEGRKTIEEVDKLSRNQNNYFKALVALKLQGTSKVEKTLDNEINFRGLQFVRVANELHESPANIRFKGLMDFNAEELYFMMIGSQDEIYTSSFTWMFDRMMEKMKPMSGDAFLEKVHKSRFRTFLRMSAGYNEISKFLNSMDENHQNELMKEFVSGLEKGPLNDLEDAVDVADAFGSLTDPELISFLKDEILQQYHQRINKKGTAVYALLYTIFNSAGNDSAINNDFQNILPPITYVPISVLKNKDGKIVQQVFFYGDKDGMGAFNGYLSLFRNGNWKIERNKYWATVTATGKVPIEIYVNVPLPEEADENDVYAQKQLQTYIDDNALEPSIVIHRGHSYYLPTTLEHLSPAAKIVILGSCGGYHNLAKVLDASPDANIISSKQVGAYRVNTPIISAVNKMLLAGEDVNWIEMWHDLSRYFAAQGAVTNDLFSDYVPPNKNLGAIFIKAYRKQIDSE